MNAVFAMVAAMSAGLNVGDGPPPLTRSQRRRQARAGRMTGFERQLAASVRLQTADGQKFRRKVY